MSKPTYFVQECPTCGRNLRIRVAYLGQQVLCNHCKARFEASDPADGVPPPEDSGLGLLRRAEELIELVERQRRQDEHKAAN